MIPSAGIQLDYPKIDEIYGRFAALAMLGAEPGGLLLYCSLGSDGIATVMAANVAGVASLGIEPDAAIAKQALRAGVCDFVVNSLDESLRILKNEVRQQRAVSVVVTDAVDTTVAEIVARGVQPDILTLAVTELMERGAKMLPHGTVDTPGESLAVAWGVQREPMRWLPALDSLAAEILGSDDATRDWRVRWLEASPRYLGKTYAGQRYVRMTPAEADHFKAAVESAVKAGEVQVAVRLERNGESQTIES